jgi:hypothetical protein
MSTAANRKKLEIAMKNVEAGIFIKKALIEV